MHIGKINYQQVLAKIPDAFAYHQIIYDEQGLAVDYIFLEINQAFETLTGLSREEVIGRRVTEVHPDIGDSAFDWIGTYSKVAQEGGSIRFEQYFEPADRWYDVSAFSDTQGYFGVSFREVTLQKNENLALNKLVVLAHDLMQNISGGPDYQMIVNSLLELSGAKFAAINIYSRDGKKTETKAIAGLSSAIRKACQLLGCELVGKAWDVIPARINAIQEGRLMHFDNLYDSASGAIPKAKAKMLEQLSGTKQVYVIEIEHEGETIGDLIMFMPSNEILKMTQIVELFAAQVGFALARHRASEALRESRDQYQSLIDSLPGTSYRCLYDEHWTMIYMSSDVDNITGYPSSDFINNQVRSYASVICKDDNDNDLIISRAIEEGEIWDIEYRVIHCDGGVRWVHERGRGVKDDKGEVLYIDGLILDITDRKKAQEALEVSEMRNRALVEAIPDILFRYNSEGVYIDAVIKDEEMLYEKGRILYRQNKLIGKKLEDSLPVETVEILQNAINQALKSGEIQILEYNFPIKGGKRYFEARLAPLGNREVVSIVRDITERKTYMAELEFLSLHDQLTGLYNRHYFENELQRLNQSREYPIAIVSADLDGLKLINDIFGHAEGDNYLKSGAERLRSALRASDILARVGGDEFAIILPRTDSEAAKELVSRLQDKVEQHNRNSKDIPISISIGTSVAVNNKRPLEETYKEADNAMYKDKMKRGPLARTAIVETLVNKLAEQRNLDFEKADQFEGLMEQFGRYLKLNKRQIDDLKLFSKVYDLGKVNMPDRQADDILQQNNKTVIEEGGEAIHRHPEIGYRIASSSPELSGVAELILHHHENYDGSGYPLGTRGEEIPLECRLLAVVLTYSALINELPGVKKSEHDQILAELRSRAGNQLDPQLVEQFIDYLNVD